MSDNDRTFMVLALNGEVLPDEIDDFVEAWHGAETLLEINDYLGMTAQEYSFWVSNPGSIALIIAARHKHQPILEAVNDNVNSLDRLAARSGSPEKVKNLKRWIEQQSDYSSSY